MPSTAQFTYAFVVDTDTYAGSFEREMTAYCTGELGECNIGMKAALVFDKECSQQVELLSDLIAQVPDEHGILRPTSIWPTPGFWNDGMGNEWPDSMKGSPESILAYRKSVSDYIARHPGSNLLDDGETLETVLPGHHPSFQSVAMFMTQKPSPEVLAFLVERARKYQALPKNTGTPDFHTPFKILGFRLIQQILTENVLWQDS